MSEIKQPQPAGLLRRIGAIFYDAILVAAVIFVAYAAAYLPLAMGFDLQETKGHWLWTLYMIVVGISFHLWFWTHGGQTLGMRVWHIKLIADDGNKVTFKQAVIRYLVAILSLLILGLGFIWGLFNPHKKTWHDIASKSSLIIN